MSRFRRILKPFKPVLKPLYTFILNVQNMFRYNIKEDYISKAIIDDYLSNLKYELEVDIKDLKRPKIATPHETIDKIIEDKVSLSRFGDGEFELLFNRSILFQKSDTKLSERLNEIVTSNNDKVLIGIPYFYWNTLRGCSPLVKKFVRETISKRRKEYEKCVNFEKQYYSTEFTQLYMTSDDELDMSEYFQKIKRIWENRDVTIIQGRGITKDFKFDIFENVNSVDYIYGPSQDAFSEYDTILQSAKQINKNRLVLIILGPTATILAYDLSNLGYQAIDIGHTAKDYDFYKKGINKSDNNVHNFFLPD